MTIWILIGVMVAVAVALLLGPLFRRPENGGTMSADLAIYRDQLAEIDRDVARGLIDADGAEAARREVERRILDAADPEAAATTGGRGAIAFALVATLLVPTCALFIYLGLGRPDLVSAPPPRIVADNATAGKAAGKTRQAMLAAVTRLAERLEASPGDLDGWLLLARAYIALERFDDAAGAYRRAMGLGRGRAAIVAAYGEALVLADSGVVTPAARAAFEAALRADPKEAKARFFLALADAQAGELAAALAAWRALAADAPEGASWLALVHTHIAQAMRELEESSGAP